MAKELKTQFITVKVTPSDKAAIIRAAERAGMYPSEFMRAATLTVMVAHADPHALKQLLRGAQSLFLSLTDKSIGGRKAVA